MRPIHSAAACLIAIATLAAPSGSSAQARRSTVTVNVGCEWRGYASWGFSGTKLWIVNTLPHLLPAGTRVTYTYTRTPRADGHDRDPPLQGSSVLSASLGVGGRVPPFNAPTLSGAYEPAPCHAQAIYDPALVPPQINPNQLH